MIVEVSRLAPATAGKHESLGSRLDALGRRVRAALDAESVAVLLVDVDAGESRLIAEAGVGRSELGRHYPLADGLAARAILNGEVVTTDELLVEHLDGEGVTAAAAPIHSGHAVDGAICATFGREPDERDLTVLDCAAETAGAFLEHEAADLRASGAAEATVSVLSELVDLRDGYVAADAQEVVRLATALGERLGITDEELAELSFAARVHDIGKIGVPDRILHKAGKLDEEERSVMQRHTTWGAQTLARMPGLEGVAEIVLSSHERWDGKGYPAGKRGEETPLESRIIGVCDAYRAMTSDRPYRQALPAGRALALIQTGAGTLFDPDVVESLVEVLGEEGVSAAESVNGDQAAALRRDAAGKGSQLWPSLQRLEALPVLAESRQRLLEQLREPNPSTGRLAQVVEADVALTGSVLRLANAQAGDARGRVAGVVDAVEALGPAGLQTLVCQLGVTDFFEKKGGWSLPPDRFRLHALAVREAALAIEREVGFGSRDELAASAMLHDIGKLALAHAHDDYPDRYHADTPDDRVRVERRELGLDHAAVGAIALRRWGLPEAIARAVEAHHTREAEGMAAILRLADLLAHFSHGGGVAPREMVEAGEAIGMDETALRSLMYELSAGHRNQERRAIDPSPLTQQETLALRGLAGGKMYKEIAEDMGLSTSTVRSHLHKAYGKLGVPDRAQAVLVATERGWL
ncbi:MAG TPA: HD domain-containing phosphohydrolase [Thermoleophilaceae bacterium]|nr:HD domain-containing phosphohydrolase [Thermoleophilaceae bacterium]